MHNSKCSYVDAGVLNDPIVLSIEDAIESFLQLKDELLPKGFQDWREFGAPKGSPGQTSHHPGVKQHELYGWLLTMHFVAALELVTFLVSNDKHDHFPINTFGNESHRGDKIMLPAPIYANDVAPSKLFSLFYGYDTAPEKNQMTWKMNPVYCSTTYDPILSNSLQDIITSGTLGEDLDIMLPRGAQMYNKGWVLDLGENEKKAKKKTRTIWWPGIHRFQESLLWNLCFWSASTVSPLYRAGGYIEENTIIDWRKNTCP